MNEIINKLLLAKNKFMPEMHLKRLGFTYRACRPFTKNKKEIQILKEIEDLTLIRLGFLRVVFSWGGWVGGSQLDPPLHIFKRIYLISSNTNISIWFDTIVKQSIYNMWKNLFKSI